MKKGFVITFFCLFLTGCSTISTLFENIFSFGEDNNNNSSYFENKNGTKISKNPSLPVPESYEVALKLLKLINASIDEVGEDTLSLKLANAKNISVLAKELKLLDNK